jgi:predicted CXXCH cytochrome family protein
MTKILIRGGALGALGLLLLFGLTLTQAQAAPARQQEATPAPQPVTSQQQCLDCHTAPDQIMALPNGESLYLTIDGEAYAASTHGSKGYTCVQCHTDITTFPHTPLEAQSLRQVSAALSESCELCHTDQFTRQLDSVHQAMREQGNEDAAVCSDCHNPHYTQPPAEPRSKIITTCARCHSRIADEYRDSIHGAALISTENPDVPTCIDCHGVHNIPDPRTAQFLLKSPEICADCHSDAARMARYGVNTDVIDTYIADFHGTTVTLFEQQSPDQLPNKPLCIDCHGVHNIKLITDTESQVIKRNLLVTCQKCHPDATANFPDAWLSHYTPSPQHNALVYYVELFYRFFIPTVIGGMVVMVVADLRRQLASRLKGGKK